MNDLIILAILLDGPQHGYALKKRAGMVLNQPELHNNIVYPLLNRFIENDWVNKKEMEGERGQTRQVYSLTAAGRQELIRRLSEFDDRQAHSESEFLLRVSLFPLLPAAVKERILNTRAALLERRNQHLGRLQRSEGIAGFPAEVVNFNRSQVQAELKWIKKLSRLRPRKKE